MMIEVDKFLTEDDLSWLVRFYETAEDDQSFDLPKGPLNRLVDIGVVRHCGFAKYCTTSFGDWIVSAHFEQNPSLPLTSDFAPNH
jgi:uncharacterized protein YyaL (SSP411 family)